MRLGPGLASAKGWSSQSLHARAELAANARTNGRAAHSTPCRAIGLRRAATSALQSTPSGPAAQQPSAQAGLSVIQAQVPAVMGVWRLGGRRRRGSLGEEERPSRRVIRPTRATVRSAPSCMTERRRPAPCDLVLRVKFQHVATRCLGITRAPGRRRSPRPERSGTWTLAPGGQNRKAGECASECRRAEASTRASTAQRQRHTSVQAEVRLDT